MQFTELIKYFKLQQCVVMVTVILTYKFVEKKCGGIQSLTFPRFGNKTQQDDSNSWSSTPAEEMSINFGDFRNLSSALIPDSSSMSSTSSMLNRPFSSMILMSSSSSLNDRFDSSFDVEKDDWSDLVLSWALRNRLLRFCLASLARARILFCASSIHTDSDQWYQLRRLTVNMKNKLAPIPANG